MRIDSHGGRYGPSNLLSIFPDTSAILFDFDIGDSCVGMDFDFTTDNSSIFTDTMYTPSNQSCSTPTQRQLPVTPKTPVSEISPLAPLARFKNDGEISASGVPFSGAGLGTVDPRLLFGGHNSASSPTARPAARRFAQQPYGHQLRESGRDQEELWRCLSAHRGIMSTPIKGHGRWSVSKTQRKIDHGNWALKIVLPSLR